MKKYIALGVTVIVLAVGAYITQRPFFIQPSVGESLPPTETSGTSQTPPSNTSSSTQGKISRASLLVGGKTYDITAAQGETVFDAMEQLRKESDFQFTYRNFSGLGAMIESVSGKKNESGNYWMLYVNGTLSQKGASETFIKPGDVIEWKYEQTK